MMEVRATRSGWQRAFALTSSNCSALSRSRPDGLRVTGSNGLRSKQYVRSRRYVYLLSATLGVASPKPTGFELTLRLGALGLLAIASLERGWLCLVVYSIVDDRETMGDDRMIG